HRRGGDARSRADSRSCQSHRAPRRRPHRVGRHQRGGAAVAAALDRVLGRPGGGAIMIEAKRRVSVLVGALVLVVSVALAGILIFLGSATRIFARTVRVNACFSDVTGLRTGASVVVAGVAVGTVARVSLGEVCPGEARVELSLDTHAVPHLSADSRAKLAT